MLNATNVHSCNMFSCVGDITVLMVSKEQNWSRHVKNNQQLSLRVIKRRWLIEQWAIFSLNLHSWYPLHRSYQSWFSWTSLFSFDKLLLSIVRVSVYCLLLLPTSKLLSPAEAWIIASLERDVSSTLITACSLFLKFSRSLSNFKKGSRRFLAKKSNFV